MSNYRGIVSRQWLQDNLANPDVKVIDCRFRLSDPNWGYQQYLQSHIPGAYYFDLDRDLSSPRQKHGGRHPLPEPNIFASKLEKIGVIKDKTTVVAYDDSRFPFSARLWWLLRYFGHQKVVLLDGGWHGWQENNCPMSKTLPKSALGFFQPQIADNFIVDIEKVKQSQGLSSVALIDSRSGDRYRGEKEPIDPVAGHIPGAVNLFWQKITDPQGKIVPIEIQKTFWQPFQDKEEIIVYCGSGVTACVNLFSLEMSGIKGAKLYPGGWSDWCSYFSETQL